ncbi:hypothetical protein [Ideonella sp.]|jgi:hypothetical protein|uniref:hypothetical protein n=1 Tax=Ideonella sp. TaxID=1929293 RepID=UPI0037BF5BCF
MKLDLSPVALGQPAITATFENTTSVRLVAIVDALSEWGPWRERVAATCKRLADVQEAEWFLMADSEAAPGFPFMDDFVSPAKSRMFNELFAQIDQRINGASPSWAAGWYLEEKNPHRFTEYQAVLDEMREILGGDAYLQMLEGEPVLRMPRHIYTAADLAELLTVEGIKAQTYAAWAGHELVGRLAVSVVGVARVLPELEIVHRAKEPAKLFALPSRAENSAKVAALVATFKRPKNKADQWTQQSTEELRRQIIDLNVLGVSIKDACITVAEAWNRGLPDHHPERVEHESIATHWRGSTSRLEKLKRANKDKRQA